MRILILGGTGMLGHRLWINLQVQHEVWVSVRQREYPFPKVVQFPERLVHLGMDALREADIARALSTVEPDLVINCIGLIKQLIRAGSDPIPVISLNALLPHQVSRMCQEAGARLIHISTDCVFSGRKGNYAEADTADAEDIYGRTKQLGEPDGSASVTLRTSIIGHELHTRLGLVEWFLGQTERVRGYRRVIFTGLTTDEMSRVILDHVIPHPEITGVYHAGSEPIAKFDLLRLMREAYGLTTEIVPDDDVVCDRSLNSVRFREATGYRAPSWGAMVAEMASHSSFYTRVRS